MVAARSVPHRPAEAAAATSPAATAVVELPVVATALAGGGGGARYFLLQHGASPDAPVPVAWADDASGACEVLLGPERILCSAPWPRWVEGQPQVPPDAQMALCLDRLHRAFLVGPADASTEGATHGQEWARFSPSEVRAMRAVWGSLRRRWPPDRSPPR